MFIKSVAQSNRVSLWLWSVAANPNPSNLGAQDNKVLIQLPDPTVYILACVGPDVSEVVELENHFFSNTTNLVLS